MTSVCAGASDIGVGVVPVSETVGPPAIAAASAGRSGHSSGYCSSAGPNAYCVSCMSAISATTPRREHIYVMCADFFAKVPHGHLAFWNRYPILCSPACVGRYKKYMPSAACIIAL